MWAAPNIGQKGHFFQKKVHQKISPQTISQEEKKFCVLHELGNEMQPGIWVDFEPLNGFRGTRRQHT